MHKPLTLAVGVLVTIGLALIVQSRGSSSVRQSMMKDISDLGGEVAQRPAPPWTLKDRAGQPVSLEKYRGKVIFLNFWASWCPPCREEMPSMEELARKYAGRDLVMIAASQDSDPQAMNGFLGQVMPKGQLAMSIVFDPNGQVARQYGTQLLPETYIIDRQGQIVARFVDKYDWMRPEVDRFIERLLRQPY